MNSLVQFFTDTATLAIFDPARLTHRHPDEGDWWCDSFLKLDEVRSGAIALVGLGGDGVYQARVTDGVLTPDEHDYAAEVVRGLGVEVVSRSFFVGPGECLPGGDSGSSDTGRGKAIVLANGNYDVEAYAINWFDSPRWWNEDHHVPTDAPADFVVVMHPRACHFHQLDSEPRFMGFPSRFVFDSPSRRIGPEPGMILSTSVLKGPSGLMLKDCGPCDYQASLIDYSGVEWKDRIRFEVISVDHHARSMTGNLIEKVKPGANNQ